MVDRTKRSSGPCHKLNLGCGGGKGEGEEKGERKEGGEMGGGEGEREEGKERGRRGKRWGEGGRGGKEEWEMEKIQQVRVEWNYSPVWVSQVACLHS